MLPIQIGYDLLHGLLMQFFPFRRPDSVTHWG
ncbi:hypothetical protein CH54_1571 [Yersinia rochesterensis]|uniref:Uncharacterized protein n=1 Tax=Yersinia rochesterensis TaxID=1604335 RepID=A0ABM5SRN7_9GAMM|nr:hypothetical protein DJ57_2423 [Yersinia rochesterensis]AJI86243.1 hypothetical protein AW19_92 [Yersinia frederiksenii Y225]AJJ37225.1 hypothetical protein CH54_1571 [Yersinia rochesterensis]